MYNCAEQKLAGKRTMVSEETGGRRLIVAERARGRGRERRPEKSHRLYYYDRFSLSRECEKERGTVLLRWCVMYIKYYNEKYFL